MTVENEKAQEADAKWWLKSVPEVTTWSDINILRFLRLYQRHPMLWNVRDSEYKNVCSRLRAYKHIAETLKLTNVNKDECMKLVDWLKKRYVEEKQVRRAKCRKRPAWFEIITSIVKRILNPDTEEKDLSFEACKVCCANAPCNTESSVSSDYQACKDCCADQNLHPPCEYYKLEENDEDDNPCNFKNVECYTICNDEVKVVLLSLGAEKHDESARNSDCDCKTEDSVDRNSDCDCKSSKKSSDSCKSDSLPRVPSSTDSKCSCLKSSTSSSTSSATSSSTSAMSASIPSVSVTNFCIQPIPADHRTSSNSSSHTSSIADEKSAGIFMDSLRFRGKRISLVDEYVCNDRGQLELVEPRLHFARCCCDSDYYYPLQLEL